MFSLVKANSITQSGTISQCPASAFLAAKMMFFCVIQAAQPSSWK